MASFDPIDFDPNAPPPRETTPPIRRGFVVVLFVLLFAAGLVYGIPYVAERVGYRYEVGRSRAATEALILLDEEGVVNRASALFRLASTRVQPAVVNVRTSRMGRGMMLGPQGPEGQGPGADQMPLGMGSGVVIDAKRGYIVTNHHVIQDADAIVVRLGRREISASLVGTDPKTDLAVLQVSAGLSAEAAWGDSDEMDICDWVLAIGSPYELDRTVTVGIVSATGRGNIPLMADTYQDFIQTDAAINPGNSGGPLINLNGEVIGINTAILSETGGYQGIGLAISSALARRVVDQLIEKGRVMRGYIGVSIRDVLPEDARDLRLPEPRGAQVLGVEPGSPADRAGLEAGDVIISINEQPVEDASGLRNRTFALPIDAEVPIVIYRRGERSTLGVTIAEMPILLDLGLQVVEVPRGQPRRRPGAPDSELIIEGVLPGTPAARARLMPKMRIVAVGPVPVETKEQLNTVIASRYNSDEGVTLQIQTPDGADLLFNIGGPRPGPRLP
ncbi:hypothetical protein BH23PLA1_BH23PLA1_33540 [soil metagenome]